MVGQNIGKYRVLDRIGRGGMGTVYKAIDETLHREVAIKVLNAELNDPEVAKRFRAEAITVARLSHPGIATIYELFQHDGQWLMVMEFVRGETLEHLVDRLGGLSPQRAAELCMQALAALAHAHSMGVVHRDLKPANLMITETGAVKIMDFGIARVAGTEHLTNAGFMMGTPAYMAPEQVMGHEIDARADLYAMGVVFYRLTTAKLPFKGDTPFAMAQSQVNDLPTPIGMFRADLPAWVQQVIVRSLSKNPEERFQSAVEFHESFARCLAGLPMTSTYNAASTNLMMTPPRPMPTGSIPRTITSAQLPVTGDSMMAPTTMQPQTPLAMPVPTQAEQTPMNTPTQAHTPVVMPSPAARPPSDIDIAPTVLAPSGRFSGGDASLPTAPAANQQSGAVAAGTTAKPSTGQMASTPAAVPGGSTDGPSGGQTQLANWTNEGGAAPPSSTGRVDAAGWSSTEAMAVTQQSGALAAGAAAAPPGSSAVAGQGQASAPAGAPAAAVRAGAKPAVKAAKKKGSGAGALAAVAAVVLIAGAGGFWFWKQHQSAANQPPAAATPTESTPSADTASSAVQSATTPGATDPGSVSIPSTAATPPPNVLATQATPVPSLAPAPKSAAKVATATIPPAGESSSSSATGQNPSPTTAATAAGRAAASASTKTPAVDDTHQAFSDVKVLNVVGKKTTDEDVLLSFVGGQISVLGKKSGTAIATLPYKSVLHATYVHGRDPKWDDTLTSPPKDLDVGGMLRTSKQWLVLQTKDSYLVLRIPDAAVFRVLEVVEARTGVVVDRPKPEK